VSQSSRAADGVLQLKIYSQRHFSEGSSGESLDTFFQFPGEKALHDSIAPAVSREEPVGQMLLAGHLRGLRP